MAAKSTQLLMAVSFYDVAHADIRASVRTLIAQMKPGSSRPTAVTI
jgi:hypothetical protein